MIECIFTIDYEIYGNGAGTLADLVLEPADKLVNVFNQFNYKFVTFVEVSELQQIEREGTDRAISDVRRQIKTLREHGFEIALHLHPQWANGKYERGKWNLDYTEYNLCTLPPARIAHIVDSAIAYLRELLREPAFTPRSFRAGNWLFQPTREAGKVLAARGIKVDSSVFAGGVQHQHKLDYRAAQANGYFWRFSDDVNVPDSGGNLLEMPIHTELVPFWKMMTRKRVGLQRQYLGPPTDPIGRFERARDFLRLRHPRKFDFCRMTFGELVAMVEKVRRDDAATPTVLKPLVAIGHTKDLVDLATVEAFLKWLRDRAMPVSTFESVYEACNAKT